MIEQLARVRATASLTVLKTGTPATSWPPRPGVTPATTLVPYSIICRAWNSPSRPVMPWTSRRVLSSTRTLIGRPGRRDDGVGGLLHGRERLDPALAQQAA